MLGAERRPTAAHPGPRASAQGHHRGRGTCRRPSPRLEAALEAAETAPDTDAEDGDERAGERGISLRQRVWPMLEMLRRAMAEDTPVVWGV